MMTKAEQAVELFRSGFNCSQSVLAVFCEKYGLPQKTALKLACGLGGGVRSGEICGAASGAVIAIGLKQGQSISADKETKSLCYVETVDFLNRFREQNGSIVCRAILKHDISTKTGMEQAQQENLFQTVCVDMITRAVKILEEMEY